MQIYPSEFGLERMRKEEEEGPTELVRQSSKTKDVAADRIKDNFEENSQDSDGSEEDDSGNEMSGNEVCFNISVNLIQFFFLSYFSFLVY